MSQILSTVEGLGGTLAGKGKAILDNIFPPEKRAELLARIKGYVLKNPKLSAFLASNLVLTGGPLIIFALFSLTVLVFSIVVALVVGLLAAVLFTVLAVGAALLVLFPTIFFTTLVACFIFLWGLGGFYLFKWFNKGDTPALPGTAVGDKLNSLTGGRLSFLMDANRDQQNDQKRKEYASSKEKEKEGQAEKEDSVHDAQVKTEQQNGHATSNGTPKKPTKLNSASPNGVPKQAQAGVDGAKKGLEAGKDQATKGANGVHKNVGDTAGKVQKTANLDGVTGKATNATGTVRGTLGGATGLM